MRLVQKLVAPLLLAASVFYPYAGAQRLEEIASWTAHGRDVRGLAFVPGTDLLVSGSFDTTVALWNLSEARLEWSFQPQVSRYDGDFDIVTSVAVSHDGRLLVVGSQWAMSAWDIPSRSYLSHFQESLVDNRGVRGHAHSGPVLGAVFMGDYLASVAGGGYGVKLWSLETFSEMATIEPPTPLLTSIAPVPNNNLIATGGESGTVYVWNLSIEDGVIPEWAQFQAYRSTATKVSLSAPLALMAVGHENGKIALWDLLTDFNPEIVDLDGSRISALGFTPDGYWLVVGTARGALRVWDMLDGRAITLRNAGPAVTALAFDSLQPRFAIGLRNGDIALYSLPD